MSYTGHLYLNLNALHSNFRESWSKVLGIQIGFTQKDVELLLRSDAHFRLWEFN